MPRFLRSPNFVPLPSSSSRRRRRLAASLLPSFVPSVLPLTETNERRKSLTHCEHQRGCKNAAACSLLSVLRIWGGGGGGVLCTATFPPRRNLHLNQESGRGCAGGLAPKRTKRFLLQPSSPSLSIPSLPSLPPSCFPCNKSTSFPFFIHRNMIFALPPPSLPH